jgi:hypothetical protein
MKIYIGMEEAKSLVFKIDFYMELYQNKDKISAMIEKRVTTIKPFF